MRILDQYGKPVRPGLPFMAPRWLLDEAKPVTAELEATRRVLDLRQSCGVPPTVTGGPIGDVVTVRKPTRFTAR
jgi:hypothetical protein